MTAKRKPNKETFCCPFCYVGVIKCPECGVTDQHGLSSHCSRKACKEVGAPMQCFYCGRVVSRDKSGVLDFDMTFVPYEK